MRLSSGYVVDHKQFFVIAVFILWCDSPVYAFSVPAFLNTLSVPYSYVIKRTTKMEQSVPKRRHITDTG